MGGAMPAQVGVSVNSRMRESVIERMSETARPSISQSRAASCWRSVGRSAGGDPQEINEG